ncbi:outer membrane insertion C- signal [Roseivirga pacifica]|uniref:outer membrane insertion C- signal n=1 Tax=Roseivirga pacifica TaxID=1267423 RepID=UPI002095F842|nr:outer membrane insertion C- signal [Roseivirga pacifica]MCO6357539.1 outer membrane insertion C- signal [Roseivirga pacifica]MCO6367696.1 outer membrane insertion C- signal [Roseivirga pacifica]MCO6369772.1 outer membrane insertion C- signal [Roseivirga pacifica]MCO6373626.1 outer membrane insertion C- signal [Roseivirga pacifica]MCO6377069.1 outer membrane insertion C- signal [Roseivirga pacifica]
MKKLIFVFALFLFAGLSQVNAQSEIGVRFGDVTGGSFAVDGIIGIGEFSRVHANVSFGGNDGVDFGVDALWDFIYRPLGEESFNWYVGAGPFLGFGDDFAFGAAGEIGLEYRFQIPLSLSIDWRPYFRIVEDTDFYAGGFGLNVRYILGNGN